MLSDPEYGPRNPLYSFRLIWVTTKSKKLVTTASQRSSSKSQGRQCWWPSRKRTTFPKPPRQSSIICERRAEARTGCAASAGRPSLSRCGATRPRKSFSRSRAMESNTTQKSPNLIPDNLLFGFGQIKSWLI